MWIFLGREKVNENNLPVIKINVIKFLRKLVPSINKTAKYFPRWRRCFYKLFLPRIISSEHLVEKQIIKSFTRLCCPALWNTELLLVGTQEVDLYERRIVHSCQTHPTRGGGLNGKRRMTEDTKRNNETHWQARHVSKSLVKSITNEAMCFGRWVYSFPSLVLCTTNWVVQNKRD